MNYKEAIEILFTKLPMFQRKGPAAYKANLDGTLAVCKMLDNPQNDLKSIHIAGTNGKGTVAHMLSAVLQKAGYSVGLFTSPHLVDFRERIRINGEMISTDEVIHFVEEHQNSWGTPSFFELTFGMALKCFLQNSVDIVILETGMGGRLDSTNVIPSAEVCVITNIGLDHQTFLGDTVREIALEKAGIIKDGIPVVLGRMRPEAQSVILGEALRKSSEMNYGRIIPDGVEVESSPFFKDNAATAFAAIEVLRDQKWEVSDDAIVSGLNDFRNISVQTGRFQTLPASPEQGQLLIDCAHNVDGMTGLMNSISSPDLQLHIVFGTVGDKDPSSVLALIPKNSTMYWCSADVPRSMSTDQLLKLGTQTGLNGSTYTSVSSAVSSARLATCNDDSTLAVVCGSVFVVGEAL